MKKIPKSVYLNLRGIILRAVGHCVRQGRDAHLQPGAIKRILFIRLDRIGDVVLSTPAIRALKQHFQGAELTVLLRSSTRGLVERNPFVDRIVTVDNVGELVGVIRKLQASRFDLVVDPYDDWPLESALVAGLSGARIRIGFAVGGREAFFNVRLPKPGPERHTTDVVMDSLKPLGISPEDVQPKVFLSKGELASAREWLHERRNGSLPFIGIHPGASCETQRWPAEYYSKLGTLLLREGRKGVILFGGPADRQLIEAMARRIGETVLTCITGDIRRFSALVACCQLLVCNNSGPLHVACALGIPTVSFMGPSVKERWTPRGNVHRVLRRDRLYCIGCNHGSCAMKTHACMRQIGPEDALEAIRETDVQVLCEQGVG
jgi:lipopolysaccharide heptosyltransferase II